MSTVYPCFLLSGPCRTTAPPLGKRIMIWGGSLALACGFYLLVVSIVCLFRLFCLFGLFVCLVLYGPAPPLGEEDHDLGRESSLWEAQCQRAKRRRSTHWYYSIIIQPNCTYTERILNKHPKFKNLNLLHMNLSFREISVAPRRICDGVFCKNEGVRYHCLK